MVALIHLLPILSTLLLTQARPADPAPAPAYSLAVTAELASAVAHPAPTYAPEADPNAFSESKLHGLLWNAATPSAAQDPHASTTPATAVHDSSAAPSGTAVYGSGSMPVNDLNSCLAMCQATFGPGASGAPPPPPMVSAPPTPSAPPMAGTPVTHTIIVAPTKGVLRFVPFSVTAAQGDSLEFVWGAGPHSATLSAGTNVCNKSMTDTAFDSGKLNATAKYTIMVNTTTPNFHYCTVGMHCTAGMFGIVNPPTTNVTANVTASPTTTTTAAGAGSTAGSGSTGCNGDRMDCWVATWASSSPEASATVSAVQKACEGGSAWKWAASMDMSKMLGEGVTKLNVIENVMYSRLMMSMNPDMLTPEGTVKPVLPANWTAAPDLKTFVAQSALAPGAPGAPAPGTPGPDASSATGVDAAAGASNSVSGAGKVVAPMMVLSILNAGLGLIL